jgi:inositol hexakisphosphate/diphosphoinositol-pentakisphosphate kinase
MVEGVDEP